MAGLSDNTSGNSRNQTLATFGWSLLIIATLFVSYFSHLGAIGFVGPDEPRYAWIARAMAETGDWVTPRLYGQPWFEKPPLYYWGAALSFRLFGVSEAAARLPSALSALLATLALAWLAWRVYGAETARWLLLLLPTTVGMIGFSHAAATDMPFSAMLTIAMVAAALILRLVPTQAAASSADLPDIRCRGAAPLRPIQHDLTGLEIPAPEAVPASAVPPALANEILFGFFLGLAVLAKGPAAIILCGGAVFFWALITKRWRDALRLLHPVAILTFCVTALPWYILCARRNPDFFRVFIIEHNFKRYLTPEFQHIQPFWFYGPILLVAFLPWTINSLFSLRDAAYACTRTRNSVLLFFACFTIFPIVFFTLSKSKLPGYILPSIPPLGLIVAAGVSPWVRKTHTYARLGVILTGGTFVVLGVVAFIQVERINFGLAPAFLTAGGLIMMFFAGIRRFSPALLAGVLAVIACLAFSLTGRSGQALDQLISSRPAVSAARTVWNDYSPERCSTYKLSRSFQYSLNFYLTREVPEWVPGRDQPGWVFASRQAIGQLQALGLNCPITSLGRAVTVCQDPGLLRDAAGGRQPQ